MRVLTLPFSVRLMRAVVSVVLGLRGVLRVLAVVAFPTPCGPRPMAMEDQKADGGTWGPWFFHGSNLGVQPGVLPNLFAVPDAPEFDFSFARVPCKSGYCGEAETKTLRGQKGGKDGWLLQDSWGGISAGFYRCYQFAEDPVVMAELGAAGFDTAQLREMDAGFPELEAYR